MVSLKAIATWRLGQPADTGDGGRRLMPSTDTIRVHVPLSLRKRGGRPRILPPKEIETGLPPRNRSGRRAIDPADSRLLIFAGFFCTSPDFDLPCP